MRVEKKLAILAAATVIVFAGLVIIPAGDEFSLARYVFSCLGISAVTLISASIGISKAKKFGFGSAVGKSLLFLSLGMLSWSAGNLVWLYYNVFAQIEVPYPSLADIGYVGIIPLAGYGLHRLLTGIRTEFDTKTKLKIISLPFLVSIPVYWLFIQSALSQDIDPLAKVLNVIYPVGDVIFLSLSLAILSVIGKGAMAKPLKIISIGFILESIADFAFSWTTSAGMYYTGSWVDIFWVLAFFTMGIGMYLTRGMAETAGVVETRDRKTPKRARK